jgi:hypothetical protein
MRPQEQEPAGGSVPGRIGEFSTPATTAVTSMIRMRLGMPVEEARRQLKIVSDLQASAGARLHQQVVQLNPGAADYQARRNALIEESTKSVSCTSAATRSSPASRTRNGAANGFPEWISSASSYPPPWRWAALSPSRSAATGRHGRNASSAVRSAGTSGGRPRRSRRKSSETAMTPPRAPGATQCAQSGPGCTLIYWSNQ